MANITIVSKVRSFDSKEHEIIKVLDDAQTKDTTSGEVDVLNADTVSIAVRANGTAVSGGVVLLEGSVLTAEDAIWITLATITLTAGKKEYGADAANGLHACNFVRARVSTQIGNGNVDAYIGVKK